MTYITKGKIQLTLNFSLWFCTLEQISAYLTVEWIDNKELGGMGL